MIEGIYMEKKFGTVLNCIDGRTQIPIIEWMKENADLDYGLMRIGKSISLLCKYAQELIVCQRTVP